VRPVGFKRMVELVETCKAEGAREAVEQVFCPVQIGFVK
jgi:hypothetical protein